MTGSRALALFGKSARIEGLSAGTRRSDGDVDRVAGVACAAPQKPPHTSGPIASAGSVALSSCRCRYRVEVAGGVAELSWDVTVEPAGAGGDLVGQVRGAVGQFDRRGVHRQPDQVRVVDGVVGEVVGTGASNGFGCDRSYMTTAPRARLDDQEVGLELGSANTPSAPASTLTSTSTVSVVFWMAAPWTTNSTGSVGASALVRKSTQLSPTSASVPVGRPSGVPSIVLPVKDRAPSPRCPPRPCC